jgi:hypothetical protein
MRVKLIIADNYRSNQLSTLETALQHFSNAVNSNNFYNSIKNHPGFDSRLTNIEIYEVIMRGQELDSGADEEADLDLTMDDRHSTDKVGYTIETRIFTFRNMFNALNVFELAGHYAHEYCHTLGFKDPGDFDDITSNVPYEVGRLITEISDGFRPRFILRNQQNDAVESSTRRIGDQNTARFPIRVEEIKKANRHHLFLKETNERQNKEDKNKKSNKSGVGKSSDKISKKRKLKETKVLKKTHKK